MGKQARALDAKGEWHGHAPQRAMMKRFLLDRHEDKSEVSGLGMVAEGIQFTDGTVALRWRTNLVSTAIYNNMADVEAIHGHEGTTKVVWLDQ